MPPRTGGKFASEARRQLADLSEHADVRQLAPAAQAPDIARQRAGDEQLKAPPARQAEKLGHAQAHRLLGAGLQGSSFAADSLAGPVVPAHLDIAERHPVSGENLQDRLAIRATAAANRRDNRSAAEQPP